MVDANEYRDLDHLHAKVEELIEGYYNPAGPIRPWAYQSPEEYEQVVTPKQRPPERL